MARPAKLGDAAPVQFLAERKTRAAAHAKVREANRRHGARFSLADYLRICLDDLASGRVSLSLSNEGEGEQAPRS